jgi:hypothetical protein
MVGDLAALLKVEALHHISHRLVNQSTSLCTDAVCWNCYTCTWAIDSFVRNNKESK